MKSHFHFPLGRDSVDFWAAWSPLASGDDGAWETPAGKKRRVDLKYTPDFEDLVQMETNLHDLINNFYIDYMSKIK